MGKGIGPAIIVMAVVLAMAFVFSTTYFTMNLYRVHHVHTILLVLLWVSVAGALLFVLWTRSLKREEMVRRFYLDKDYIYNHEIGYASIASIAPDKDAYELVTFAAESLARMSYGFEVATAPNDFSPNFLVKSNVFVFHEPYVEEGTDDADELDGTGDPDEADCNPVVIDKWEGGLFRTTGIEDEKDYELIGSFGNARELALLLQGLEALYVEAHGGARDDIDAASTAEIF